MIKTNPKPANEYHRRGLGVETNADLPHRQSRALKTACVSASRKGIELSFPFETISEIAEAESWRKEIYRPIYHIHKWWAQRLGSVFRAIIISTCAPAGTDIMDLFYKATRFPETVIYDPFMGSGTTVGEALKLGCRVIGRDINPVSYLTVKNAMTRYSPSELRDTFHAIEKDVAKKIKGYYKAHLNSYGLVDVLYYFWVKVLPCPKCGTTVDLFSRRIFAQHASPKRHPIGKALCPTCGAINSVMLHKSKAQCHECGTIYNPKEGPAGRTKATCPTCGEAFPIATVVKTLDTPPQHRMYAKMVLKPNGEKSYVTIDDFDESLYEKARQDLIKCGTQYPKVSIQRGYNTDQALGYNYKYWHQMFNSRQLLCLSLLANRIAKIKVEPLRYLFTCLFSGCLEFNNMFCSFKGEGTGAVRHMFAHHILKPERTPLEANPWGTPKSSGAFSTLFERRILRALSYQEDPSELRISYLKGRRSTTKVFGINNKIGGAIASSYSEFNRNSAEVYLSCGTSSKTDIPDNSVDAIITDPPFFDNVHYSQLADFFYVWQRHILGPKGIFKAESTRSTKEVQQTDTNTFVDNLASVFKDCNRVLKHRGLLTFTYHHSRNEGWTAIIKAVRKAGFYIEVAHPVKSEMSVAMPKRQAKEPIDIDVILVCRKISLINPLLKPPENLVADCSKEAAELVRRFNTTGKKLSRNDVKVILMGRMISRLSRIKEMKTILKHLDSNEKNFESLAEVIWREQGEVLNKWK